MKTLHFDCSMGAAGDMLAAALLDLVPDRAATLARLNAIGIPGVEYSTGTTTRCGIAARRLVVRVHGVEEGHHDHGHGHNDHEHGHEHHDHEHGHEHHHHHAHSTLDGILSVVEGLALPKPVAGHVAKVFTLLAKAEARVHGGSMDAVHFHEVGSLDAIADISAVALLLDEIAPDVVTASPINVGAGTVRCAHGLLPVPAPCTAALLEGVAAYAGDPEDGELCTPTGAALLRHYAMEFRQMPPMKVLGHGSGAGAKELPKANLVRAFLGEPIAPASAAADVAADPLRDEVCEFRCAIDDMTAEDLAYAAEAIMADGALDVSMLAALMKKGRPGTILEVLCKPADREAIARSIFRNTTTIGLREATLGRRILRRGMVEATTPLGKIRVKVAEGYGVRRAKPEFEDLARAVRGADGAQKR